MKKTCSNIYIYIYISFGPLKKQTPQPVPMKSLVKKENQWFDVGIVKVTNMVVTHFYMPGDDSQVEVSPTQCCDWVVAMSDTRTALIMFVYRRMTRATCQTTLR